MKFPRYYHYQTLNANDPYDLYHIKTLIAYDKAGAIKSITKTPDGVFVNTYNKYCFIIVGLDKNTKVCYNDITNKLELK